MCSTASGRLWVSRVVYALGSPAWAAFRNGTSCVTIGMSRRMPEIFGAVPEVVSGVRLGRGPTGLARISSPLAWEIIKFRGLLTAPCPPRATSACCPAQNVFCPLPQNPVHAESGNPASRFGGSDVERMTVYDLPTRFRRSIDFNHGSPYLVWTTRLTSSATGTGASSAAGYPASAPFAGSCVVLFTSFLPPDSRQAVLPGHPGRRLSPTVQARRCFIRAISSAASAFADFISRP